MTPRQEQLIQGEILRHLRLSQAADEPAIMCHHAEVAMALLAALGIEEMQPTAGGRREIKLRKI